MTKRTLTQISTTLGRKYLKPYDGKMVVYKLTNSLNGLCYVGVSGRIKRRILEHIKYSTGKLKSNVHYAILKNGLDFFTFEIIAVCTDDRELNEKEEYFIRKLKSSTPEFGYNMTLGGNREVPNKETTLKKIASSHKKKVAKYDIKGNLIEVFNSFMEAERSTGIKNNDIHRCVKRGFSAGGFLFARFDVEPEKNIKPFVSRRGNNFKIKGRKAHNRIKCSLTDKKTGKTVHAVSLNNLSSKTGMHVSTLHNICKNVKHKKYLVIKEDI